MGNISSYDLLVLNLINSILELNRSENVSIRDVNGVQEFGFQKKFKSNLNLGQPIFSVKLFFYRGYTLVQYFSTLNVYFENFLDNIFGKN